MSAQSLFIKKDGSVVEAHYHAAFFDKKDKNPDAEALETGIGAFTPEDAKRLGNALAPTVEKMHGKKVEVLTMVCEDKSHPVILA